MNSNFSAVIEGIAVNATFKKSTIASRNYDGHLVFTVADLGEIDLQDVEQTLASDNIVTFGENQNEFVVNYVKASDCEAIFEKVCNTVDYLCYCM